MKEIKQRNKIVKDFRWLLFMTAWPVVISIEVLPHGLALHARIKGICFHLIAPSEQCLCHCCFSYDKPQYYFFCHFRLVDA